MTKDKIRKAIIKKRNLLSKNLKKRHDNKIFSNILDYFDIEAYNVIMFYRAYQSEANVNELIDYCLNRKHDVAIPKCLDLNGKMLAYYISSHLQLEKGMYGIEEPRLAVCDPCDVKDLEIIFVPGVAFSTNGARIGYGKGYYDVFLQQRNPKTLLVGVAYELQITKKCDILSESHDIKMDYIITEKQIYRCEEGLKHDIK